MSDDSWLMNTHKIISECYFSLIDSKVSSKMGRALIVFYFVSLDKPEFTQYAEEIATKSTLEACYSMAWCLNLGKNFEHAPEYSKIITFLRDHCERNNWSLNDWMKIQRTGWIRLQIKSVETNLLPSLAPLSLLFQCKEGG